MPDDVQPNAGQGDEATGGLFDSYLQSVPDEHRETVGSYLQDASKNVEGRLQEAAEFRKTWEPFSEIDGLSQYDPDGLTQLLAWHQQIASKPDAFQEWLQQVATEAGLLAEQSPESEMEEGEMTPAKVEEMIQQQAQQAFAPFQQRIEQAERQQAEVTEAAAIDSAFTEIESAEKLQLSEDQREMIAQLGSALAVDDKGNPLPMGDASWINKGFERFREISGAAQRAFVADKTTAPKPPLTAGGSSTVETPKTFEDASRMALERLRQS